MKALRRADTMSIVDTLPGIGEAGLDALDQRILGALLEKQRTVPASYPLTLNSLRTACNQQNSRDPISAYEDRELESRLRELKDRGLVRVVWAGKGSRTLKYHQLLEERLALADDERALLTVLLLRGAQAAGELRGRAERMHTFTDRGAVEEVLSRLAAREPPLVHELPRKAGQRDPRWVHLLGPVPGAEGPAPSGPAVDRDVVLTSGGEARDERVRSAYDSVAEAYAEQLAAELGHKPFDRWLLDRVSVGAAGRPVADVGTGSGHVAAYLAEQGLGVTGFDVSPRMVEVARRRFSDPTYEVGDLRRLMRPPTAAGWGAVTAWYALCHLAASELPGAVAALARVLDPGGVLAVAVHAGDEVRHTDEFLGEAVDLDFVLHDPADVLDAVEAAGLGDIEWYLRGPYAGVEVETQRLYVLARKV